MGKAHMHTTAISSSTFVETAKIGVSGSASTRLGLAERFVRFIESSDWERRFLRYEKKFNKVCLIMIAFSVLYLAPFIFYQFLR